MAASPRDLALLDLVDAQPRTRFAGEAWRVTREGRAPLDAGKARGRWSDGTFDVLYTSGERNGALAEIHALLTAQPVFPSQLRWRVHRLRVGLSAALEIADVNALTAFGIPAADWRERRYERSQAIAETARFLGFDGLIVPSARWPCMNVVLFTDQSPPPAVALAASEDSAVDWSAWRRERDTTRENDPFAGFHEWASNEDSELYRDL